MFLNQTTQTQVKLIMSSNINGLACILFARRILLTAGAIACAILPLTGNTQPYTPDSADRIVETLPTAIVELAADIRRTQRSPSNSTTENNADIMQRAMDSYQVALATGEARAYGRTLSILHSWPERENKPVMYHILLAAVLQHNHEFDAALEQLQPVLAAETNGTDRLSPSQAQAQTQALMMQSQIGLVTADYALVKQSCNRLQDSARRPVFVNCQAQLDGVTGNTGAALTLIADTFRTGTDLNTLDYQELLTTAAVVAHRTGEQSQAEAYYQGAMRFAPDNNYLNVNYSNLLLEQSRFDELIALLSPDADSTMNAELRILLARALRARGTEDDREQAAEIIDVLTQEFELALMRNEAIPHKEFAQHSLYLVDSPVAALSAARENWMLQKEPSDTRLLAQAAVANDDQETLSEIEQWINDVGTQDVRLQAILTANRESRS